MKYLIIILFPILAYTQDKFEITKDGFTSAFIVTNKKADLTFTIAKEYIIKNCADIGNCIISEIENKYLKFQYRDRIKYSWKNMGTWSEEMIIVPEIEIDFKDNRARVKTLFISEFGVNYEFGLLGLTKNEVISNKGFNITPAHFFKKNGKPRKWLSAQPYKEAIEKSINKTLSDMLKGSNDDDW
ncbi:hypothetical protein [Flavivirga jejuensis]|uniref:GLPGLI family protein n=1 Tax=Flavivirga jejuensis TaxID=870487 RepID=A0ABT8WKN1_9FLAO|nr:hypothetical protein [Flavivirga jejuensis]MDO5973526.1 hypothetical protein [Flavivirga jejuensis]